MATEGMRQPETICKRPRKGVVAQGQSCHRRDGQGHREEFDSGGGDTVLRGWAGYIQFHHG
eukprot:12371218-Prorocentrum_lima.AAC.1